MKRFIVSLMLGVGLLSGCSDTQTVLTAAGLSGTYDLALVGRYLFVASSDRNELRVLDLEASPRDFVRAPNPIEPLAIPVLERPLQLARDVRYAEATVSAEGRPDVVRLEEVEGGPYVYVRSAGSGQISIVAADPAWFKEVKRLEGLGLVTAFAARGPMGGKDSVLYYATQEATGARLYRLPLPGPDALAAMGPLQGTEIPGLALAGETVTALLVLPPTPQQMDQEHLVVATRSVAAGAPTGGRTFRVDANSGAVIVPDYQFGAPVRLLATHPLVPDPNEEGERCDFDPTPPRPEPTDPADPWAGLIEAGTYVFGVLDESFCGGQAQCSGVLAVEAATGQVPNDSTGVPMLPITVGNALPTGLTLASNARVALRCRRADQGVEDSPLARAPQIRPLVGIVPSSDGQITLFDAVRMRPFDFDTGGARVAALRMVDSTGREREITSETKLADAITVALREGATRDEIYRLVYEGSLPNLASRPLSDTPVDCASTPGACIFQVEAKTLRQTDGSYTVQPGDIVALEGDPATCQGGLGDLVVSEVRVSGGIAQIVTSPIPEACAAQPRYSVRVAPGTFAVYTGSYQGRLSREGTLTAPGGYFFHPKDFQPGEPPFRARITLEPALARVKPEPVRADQYVISVQSGFQPFVFWADSGSLASGLAGYRLPGPVVHTRVGDLDLAYIAYPSADGILQVNLGAIVDNEPNVRGLVPFE